ncbi:uncharacterized protein LOC112522104 [Cynara cardunculus var. scolymus]|uniref:uncharacterized protein LOC112522104 n=1 Tax=Cynara cardunculus var. scolymus TaxID=59895 RepID=UPI000D6303EB|nr:uncharacterized protein LOC112522104 [Cynara cardunculus var. scolymus]
MDGEKRRVDSRCIAADGKDNTIIDQIMLRFRPIAPRPVTVESSGHALPSKDWMLKRKRVKRKYVRVKKKKRAAGCSLTINDNKSWFGLDRAVAMLEDSKGNELVLTDPLQKVSNWISFDVPENNRKSIMRNLINYDPPDHLSPDLHGVDLATAVRKRKVVESWITIESVTGTCEDRRLLGYTDEEIWKNLESDSCPGFISNSFDEVLWVNPAYRRMLDLNSEDEAPATEVAVWLRLKVEESTVVKYLPALSCRVRIVYRLSEKKTQMMVPCDVCKMDSGGFAWRLDVKSALSLGPLS